MIQQLKNLVLEEKGQAMTEYGLIIGLIAVVVIGMLTTMGGQIKSLFEYVSGELAKVVK